MSLDCCKILKINWNFQSRHPGSYDLQIMKPVHDGYRYMLYYDVISKLSLKWDEYEDNIFSLIKQMKSYDFVKEEKQVILNFWSIFVYTFDSWFSNQNFDIQNHLYKTMDIDSSFDCRLKALDNFLKLLDSKHSWVFNHWLKNMQVCIDNYAYWINDIKNFHDRI